jgi:Ca-activated chloride channel family protein
MKRLSEIGRSWCCGLLLVLFASTAFGQGVLIVIDHPVPLPRPRPTPPPPLSYKIKELTYQAKVNDQIAQVQVSQSFVNTGSRPMEVAFCFPLPYEGSIDRMTFLVDGKEYEAKLLDAKKARDIYEGYIRKNKDPALLEWVGHGMFKTSVFPVPAGAERTVTLKYSQLLRKDQQLTDFLIPLSTAKYTSAPVEKLSITVNIESAQDIKSVYSPTHSINVKRPDDKHAKVTFEAKQAIPTNDFRLFFDTSDGKLSASVVSYRPDKDEEGFFLLLASPEIKAKKDDRPKKTVIFVVDRSGSMSGKKIEQAKEALKFVLNNLRDGDTFNIVAYDSTVESFQPELQKYDDQSRQAALNFVEGLYAGGSTNIDGALTTALGMINDASRPSFVLFLTDGLPTAGKTNESKIVVSAKQHNDHRARMINFGVGYDVNSRLLDRLGRENFGQSEFVRPDEDIEAHVSRLYNKMSSPVMTDVKIAIDVDSAKEGAAAVSRVYPKDVFDLFSGEQLVQVGRYKKAGSAKVTITGKVGDKKQEYDFPAKLVAKSHDQTNAFVEKLWAMRRIGEIIDELDLKGKNDELVKELVSLSTKHGILTPYTSFLADDQAKPSDLADIRLHIEQASSSLDALSLAEGRAGVSQRAEKKQLQEAAIVPLATAPAFGGYGLSGGADRSGGAGLPALAAGNRPAAAPGARAANVYRKIESDEVVVADAVQNVGNTTLYKRGNVWIEAGAGEVDLTKDDPKIERIARFSDEYFKLVAANTADENAILSRQEAGEQLIVKLRGQLYRIE